MYVPHNWILVDVEDVGVKIASGWKGGYLDSDEWRISSLVENVKDSEDRYEVTTHSGSVYYLYKTREGISFQVTMALDLLDRACEKHNKTYKAVDSCKTFG